MKVYNYEQFAKDVRMFRVAYHISAKKLGELLDVSRSAIESWSRGQTPTTVNYDKFYDLVKSNPDLSEFAKKTGRPMR